MLRQELCGGEGVVRCLPLRPLLRHLPSAAIRQWPGARYTLLAVDLQAGVALSHPLGQLTLFSSVTPFGSVDVV